MESRDQAFCEAPGVVQLILDVECYVESFGSLGMTWRGGQESTHHVVI